MDELSATHSTTFTFTVLDALRRVQITGEIHSETSALDCIRSCNILSANWPNLLGMVWIVLIYAIPSTIKAEPAGT